MAPGDGKCPNHEDISSGLVSLKSSHVTMRWVITIGLPVLVLILGSFMALAYDTIRENLREIKVDVAQIKITVNQNAISNALSQQKVDEYRREMDQIKLTLREHDRREKEDHERRSN